MFLALSRGEPHLLLPDGAYFSLDKPELRALARLIEEARALQDSPSSPLQISRYQAGFWDELASLGVIGRQAAAWQEQVQGLLSIGTVGGSRAARRASGRVAPLPAGRVRLAHVPLAAQARRHPGRRHGTGQDAAVPRPDQPRPAARASGRPVPDRRADQRRGELGRRGRAVHPGSDRGTGLRDARPRRPPACRTRRWRRRRRHVLHPAAAGLRRLRRAGLVRPAAGRGPARQEPAVQGLSVCPPTGRPGEDRDHRHAAGEQPDGAVVAAVDHGARPVPQPGPRSATTTPARSRSRATPSGWPSSSGGSSR